MGILIRLAISALTFWIATLVFKPHIAIDTSSTSKAVLTVVFVAVIFGLCNAILRPIIKTIGCWAYLLTLGLVSLVVNGALLMLTSWIAGKLDLPFNVDHFWPWAVLGALFIGVASWLLNLVVPDGKDKKNKGRRQVQPPSRGYQQYR